MEKPILDPAIPYIGPIYGGKLSPGKMVRIQGTAPGVAYRFSINLQCGPETVPRDDIAVQIAVRILDGYISVNSLQNGIWGEEQRGASLPIKRADKFEIILMCDFNQYKVAINGQHFCEFPQRIHYDRITHLAIDGDVSIVRITYESASAGGLGAASGSGSATAPMTSVEAADDEFEMIDSGRTTKPPPPGMHPVSAVGFSQPPPYEATINGSQGGGALNAPYPTGAAPYPTSAAPYHPGAMPYPTGAAPYPAGVTPYPPGATQYPYPVGQPGMQPYHGAPYPTGIPGVVGASPLPPPGAPGIPPPPLGAPIPLNAPSQNFRRIKRNKMKKCCAIFCGIFLSIIVIIAIIIVKVGTSVSRHKSYNYESHNNYEHKHSYDPDYD